MAELSRKNWKYFNENVFSTLKLAFAIFSLKRFYSNLIETANFSEDLKFLNY